MNAQPTPPVKTDEQEARSLAERHANERARGSDEPLPYPNVWDQLDPTKLPRGKIHSDEEVHRRYIEFCQLCPRPQKTKHTL